MKTTLKERLELAVRQAPHHVSQADIARACKIKGPSVSDWFSGKTRRLKMENAIAAGRLLGVSPEWLATGRGPMHPNRSSTSSHELDEVRISSQLAGLNAEILEDAETWASIFETAAGRRYGRAERARVAAEIYECIASDGGRLSDEHHREFLQKIDRLIQDRGRHEIQPTGADDGGQSAPPNARSLGRTS